VSTPSLRTLAADCATTNPVLISVSDRLIRNVPPAPFDASIGVRVPARTNCALPTVLALTGARSNCANLSAARCSNRKSRTFDAFVCCPVLPSMAGSTAMTPRGTSDLIRPEDTVNAGRRRACTSRSSIA
jgi:hypothetical protein